MSYATHPVLGLPVQRPAEVERVWRTIEPTVRGFNPGKVAIQYEGVVYPVFEGEGEPKGWCSMACDALKRKAPATGSMRLLMAWSHGAELKEVGA